MIILNWIPVYEVHLDCSLNIGVSLTCSYPKNLVLNNRNIYYYEYIPVFWSGLIYGIGEHIWQPAIFHSIGSDKMISLFHKAESLSTGIKIFKLRRPCHNASNDKLIKWNCSRIWRHICIKEIGMVIVHSNGCRKLAELGLNHRDLFADISYPTIAYNRDPIIYSWFHIQFHM